MKELMFVFGITVLLLGMAWFILYSMITQPSVIVEMGIEPEDQYMKLIKHGEATLPILVSYDATPYVVTEDGVFYVSEELYNTLKLGDAFLPNENTPRERPRRIEK